ncbi:DUF7003 family protein [Mucilaginibacter sp.]
MPTYTEQQILKQLDLAFKGEISEYYPEGNKGDIRYNFFIDLEHGYCVTAGSRLHLYADDLHWAIVFEKSGYWNRAGAAEIELDYFGNCIDYPVSRYPQNNYITNAKNIILIEPEDYEAVTNEDDFELISADASYITVRGRQVTLEKDINKYKQLSIVPIEYDNPDELIGYGDIIRYLHETNAGLISATEQEIKAHLPERLPKLMTINAFHFESAYDKDNLPGTQETYQLVAEVLVNKNPELWKPTMEANNHWSNWESGNL